MFINLTSELTRITLALIVLLAPLAAFASMACISFVWRTPSERSIGRLVPTTEIIGFVAALCTAAITFMHGPLVFSLGDWFAADDYAFNISFLIDNLSAIMMVLTSGFCGLIARFSYHYMHREAGFTRFFTLLLLFQCGMLVVVMSNGMDQLFFGWELVGIASALLVGFFHERNAPVRAGLHVITIYRLCDVGLLLGTALLHHYAHTANVASLISHTAASWPLQATHLTAAQATLVGALLVFASMGKSAQMPFGSWLPRAMEGPTPSSALFYGAISVHAGVYLLLRCEPILEQSPMICAAITLIGLATALHATLVYRVQTDVKGALAYATMTQVGLMFAAIGFGWYRWALLHMVGHACMRAFQFLRAPSALHDLQVMRSAHPDLSPREQWLTQFLSQRTMQRLYRLSFETFYFETLRERWIVQPLLNLGHRLNRAEHRWVNVLCGWEAAVLRHGPAQPKSTETVASPLQGGESSP